jgi:hypothetical protein
VLVQVQKVSTLDQNDGAPRHDGGVPSNVPEEDGAQRNEDPPVVRFFD